MLYDGWCGAALYQGRHSPPLLQALLESAHGPRSQELQTGMEDHPNLVSYSQTLYQTLRSEEGLGTLHSTTCSLHQHSGENRWYSLIVVGVSRCFAKA